MSQSSGKAEKATTHVSFVCQKCTQPIKLNRTLQAKALVEIARDVESKLGLEWSLEGPDDSEPSDIPQESGPEDVSAVLPRSSPQARKLKGRSSLETLSVIYDSLSVPSPTAKPDHRSTLKQIDIAAETFKILSSHTDVDHPLCEECPETILDSYDRQIHHMEEAKKHYVRMEKQLRGEVEGYKSQMDELDAELEELRHEEEMLKSKLLKTEEHRREISAELEVQKERETRLKAEEQDYWREFNEHQRHILQFKDDQISVQYQLHYTTEQLNRFKKTNVLNVAFHIWHNGHFGTINGLRLGRLQTVPVDWSEINAAWGQTAFLLSTLARVAGIKFERYNLFPYGNQSFIEVLDGKRRILPLYSSAGLRLFTDSKFDAAMVAFLDCLGQLKQYIEASSYPHFMLPYKINKDQIGDGKESYSVKTQFNTPERWTKALKFILTDLRWALTWVTASAIQPPTD